MTDLELALHQAEAVATLREADRDADADLVADMAPEDFAEALNAAPDPDEEPR